MLPLFLLSAYTANTAITLILLTLLTLLGEGPRIVRILEYCLIDHVYYIIPVVVVSWSILDVGKRDHFGQCFRLDWRLESPHQWLVVGHFKDGRAGISASKNLDDNVDPISPVGFLVQDLKGLQDIC